MQKQYRTAREVRERYGVTDMSIWRWLKDEQLKFPKPIVIRRRRLWDDDELDEFDARQRSAA